MKHIIAFKEKPLLDYWINGGFMVINERIFDYIKEGYDLEKEVFRDAVNNNDIQAFRYNGFWRCMNTLKESIELNNLWNSNKALWKIWK